MRFARRFVRMLPAFVAAVFFLSCLAATSHLAMAAGEGCQASHPSVRSCGQTVSLDMGPVLPAVGASLDSYTLRIARAAILSAPGDRSQYQSAPSASRSPPVLSS